MDFSTLVPIWILGGGALGVILLLIITNGGSSSMGAGQLTEARPLSGR